MNFNAFVSACFVWPVRLLTVGGFLLLAGCSILPVPQADSARYYVLTGPLVANSAAHPGGTLRIGLAQVDASRYLGKPMVVRTAGNEIVYQDNDLWAESPAVAVGRLLTEQLEATPGVAQVFDEPFPIDAQRDYDVAVHLLRFEGERKADGSPAVSLVCTIEITQAKSGGALVARETFVAPAAAWDGRDFGKLAQLLSADVNALGNEIATLLAKQ